MKNKLIIPLFLALSIPLCALVFADKKTEAPTYAAPDMKPAAKASAPSVSSPEAKADPSKESLTEDEWKTGRKLLSDLSAAQLAAENARLRVQLFSSEMTIVHKLEPGDTFDVDTARISRKAKK